MFQFNMYLLYRYFNKYMSTLGLITLYSNKRLKKFSRSYIHIRELPWPSGYELRLSLERSRVLNPVKVIGKRQEGHPVRSKNAHCSSKVPTNNWAPS